MLSQDNKNWYIECGAHTKNGYFTRNHLMPIDKVNEFRFKYDNIGVYHTAYIYDNKNQKDANLLGDFYIDLDKDLSGKDPESAFDAIREDALSCISYLKFVFGVPDSYIDIYFSGNKGLHITVSYLVFDVQPNKSLNAIYKNMAKEINDTTKHKTVDTKIYDSKRLFRMINSRHQKSMLYKIRLTHEELKACSLEQVKVFAKMPRSYKKDSSICAIPQAAGQFKLYERRINEKKLKRQSRNLNNLKPLDFTPPCVEHLLNEKVVEGQRNCTVAALASFFHQQQIDIEEAKGRLEEWNSQKCFPSMEDEEIEITLKSVYSGGYTYGCSSVREISICDKEKCPMGKRKR